MKKTVKFTWRIAIVLTGIIAAIAAVFIVKRNLGIEVKNISVGIKGLPDKFDNFTICHISDFHFTKNDKAPEKLLKILKRYNGKYDIICVTGDFAYSSQSISTAKTFLAKLDKDIYAVNGNSDIRQDRVRYSESSNADDMYKTQNYLSDVVSSYLVNENIKINKDEQVIFLAGVDEVSYDRDDLQKALENISKDGVVILLAHNPEIINKKGDGRIKLILSGHTHGGQICLPNGQALFNNTSLPLKYSSGLHKVWDDTLLYVNRGIGAVRIKLRLNCKSEVTFIKLKKKDGD